MQVSWGSGPQPTLLRHVQKSSTFVFAHPYTKDQVYMMSGNNVYFSLKSGESYKRTKVEGSKEVWEVFPNSPVNFMIVNK